MDFEKKEKLFEEILEYIKELDIVSSMDLQRKFKIGYALSNEFIDLLDQKGFVEKINNGNSNSRKVIKNFNNKKTGSYIYSATKIKEDFGFNQGTFYNRLDEANIRNKGTKEYNPEYAQKDITTGKIMFNQKAYDILSKYKDNCKNDVKSDVNVVNRCK